MCLIRIKAPAASSLLTRFVPMKAAVEDINDQGGPHPGSAVPSPKARPLQPPINSFLLKLFARQHKSILFCLRHGHQCEIHSLYLYIYIYIYSFFCCQVESDWLRRERNQRASDLGAVIGISISPLIFIRDAFVIILFFSSFNQGLNYVLS